MVTSGVVASGAFQGAATSPSADFRIVVPGRRGFELRPGRDDESYVETDEEGLVTAIVVTPPGSAGVNLRATTRFEDVVEIHKLPPGPPIDELYLEFEVVDDGLQPGDPSPEEIESAIFVAAADGDVPGDGSQNYLQATDVGAAHNDLLSPDQNVPFGIGVDLDSSDIDDFPDANRFGIELHIRAEHLPNGPPGGSNDP